MHGTHQAAEIATAVIQSRSGGRVERCHGLPHHGTYSNASHQWGVAMLMHYLWPDDFPSAGAGVPHPRRAGGLGWRHPGADLPLRSWAQGHA
jgi:hypothetical protein